MSTAGLVDLPLEIFSGEAPFIPTPDLPPGASPECQDVEFEMGAWLTRRGLGAPVYPLLGGLPNVTGMLTYTTPALQKIMLAHDSLGNTYQEPVPGVLSVIAAGGTPNAIMQGTGGDGREFLAFSDELLGLGIDIPRGFDGANWDRISQCGPGAPPVAVDGVAGSPGIAAGVHQISVIFVTRQELFTAPCQVLGSWTAAGGNTVSVTGIPTGPSNVIQRILVFTAANAANFFFIPNSFMVIDDNVTTTATGQFTDAALLSGENVDELFDQVELGEVSAFVSYALRMFAFGERNKMEEWNNLTFDGGFGVAGQPGSASNPNVPLGWTPDALFGTGGSEERVNVVWGSAYRITADGVTVTRGLISQEATLDATGNPLLVANTDYSVRARVQRSANLAAGTLRINAFSPTAGQVGVGLAVTAIQATTSYVEFIAQLFPPQVSIPSDLELKVYADGTPGPNGASFLVDCIEIFPTDTPYNTTLARASGAENPEAYNGESGLLEPDLPDGDRLVTGFKLREKFYLCGARSLFSTADDQVNEPAGWSIDEVSNKVGTPSVQGIGFGEEWCVIAARTGLYIIWAGAEPVKISQEEQPRWDAANWAAGQNLWVQVDTRRKLIMVGLPTGEATIPNVILYMDFQGLDTAQDIASYHSVRYSAYSGKILTIGDARKWAKWSITAASCGQIERPDGTQHTFLGNGTNSGKIYDLLDAQYDDDGVGIPWSYTTHAMPAPVDRQNLHLGSGRMLFGYLSGYVEGSGQMSISAQPLGNATPTQLQPLNLINPNAPPVAIAAVKRVGNVVTVDTLAPHGLVNGVDVQAVQAGVTDPSFDGTLALQVVTNPNRFSVYQYGQKNAASNGGGVSRLARRFEFTVDVVGERVTWTFANQGNTPGTWAKMEELVPWLMPEPWAPVRGSVN